MGPGRHRVISCTTRGVDCLAGIAAGGGRARLSRGIVHRREASELICKADRLGFPIKEGIPVMLEEDARKLPPEEEVA